mmetsp:Transcript_31607/g.60359  ORF Transcript_31607/g.60359 Transcript_31607/m.60359 type:complete len:105 (-) Transcript_31607:164-478(-)
MVHSGIATADSAVMDDEGLWIVDLLGDVVLVKELEGDNANSSLLLIMPLLWPLRVANLGGGMENEATTCNPPTRRQWTTIDLRLGTISLLSFLPLGFVCGGAHG